VSDETTTTRHTSREKVEAYLRESAEQAGGDMLGASAAALMPMALGRLPEDPAVLDELLLHYAALLLHLRSDGAAALCIARLGDDGEPQEPAA
jgi:hypothetical protein